MQTFLPYPNFIQSAKCLDNKRLGKQRVEAIQIFNAIQNQTGWKNHPIVKMWTGYEIALQYYHDCMIAEWIDRGFVNNMHMFMAPVNPLSLIMPNWLGLEQFHSSHRAALLAKNYDWYSQFNWKEKPEINYVWIVKDK